MKHHVNALCGYRIEVPSGDDQEASLCRALPHQHDLLMVAADLVGSGTFVDAGAHFGNHSIFLAKHGARVLAIEPDADAHAYLTRNVIDNDLAHRVTVVNCRLGNHGGDACVAASSEGGPASRDFNSAGPRQEPMTIDSLNCSVDVLRIAANGNEIEVLRGANRTLENSRPAVLIETRDALAPVTQFLEQKGYRRFGQPFRDSHTYLFVSRLQHRPLAKGVAAGQAMQRAAMAMKNVAKRIPGVEAAYDGVRNFRTNVHRSVNEFRALRALRQGSRRPFVPNTTSDVIVSLTSFPARIDRAWIVVESIFQQLDTPNKVVLVLSEQEFPNRRLPASLHQQVDRGLELMWVKDNTRSYKKLLPVREVYRDRPIVTIDDDILYDPKCLSRLFAAASTFPGSVIGHAGSVLSFKDGKPIPYVWWPRAEQNSPCNRTLLTGNGGIYYPPHVLPVDLLLDISLAMRLCPTTDDIWFWAMQRVADVPTVCLGNHDLHFLQCQDRTPQLASVNWSMGQNDVQLANVLDHFGLRGKVMDQLWQAEHTCPASSGSR